MCVSCGMCLPHCPTYQLSQTEAESPRGRISLIKGFLEDEIPVNELLISHLDHCLLCRSCESICPARVPFANLMDATKARLTSSKRIALLPRLFLLLVSRKKILGLLMDVSSVIPWRKLLKKVPGRSCGLARYLAVASKSSHAPKWKSSYPAAGKPDYTVALFTGCLESYFNAETVFDTIRVLNSLGVTVHLPASQQCCGAMHLHAGMPTKAKLMSQQNTEVFESLGVEFVISLSTACTVTLLEQQTEDQSSSGLRYTDLATFLEFIKWDQKRPLVRLSQSVYLHTPCSQRNGLKNASTTQKLLARIPGLVIHEFQVTHCCGAAGLYMLQYPDWSDQLRDQLLAQCHQQCHTIVTSNLGCLIHLRQADKMPDFEVLHPANLLAMTLGCKD